MEYHKIINLFDNTQDQPSKFRTKNWLKLKWWIIESNTAGSDIKFKNLMLRSSFCDYAYLFSEKYDKDDPNDNITKSESLEYKIKVTEKTPAAGHTKKNWNRTLEMPLINCEANLVLSWFKDCLLQLEKKV